MPKVKVPERLQEIGAEFDLKVENEVATPEEFTEVLDWVRAAIEERRVDMNEEFDDFQTEVEGIATDVLENCNDHHSPERLPDPVELLTHMHRLGVSDERIAELMSSVNGRDHLTLSEFCAWYETAARLIADARQKAGREPIQSMMTS